jgi:hypothetical protein
MHCTVIPASAGFYFFWLCPGGFAMNAMIAKYLKDFSTPTPVEAVRGDLLDSLADTSFPDFEFGADPLPPVDVEAERRQAYEDGHRAATEAAAISHAEAISAMAQAHAAEIEALVAAQENEVVGMIHRRFHEMTQALTQTLAEQTLQVLVPVFQEEVSRRAVVALAGEVLAALEDAATTSITIRGPQALCAQLKPLLDTDGIDCKYVETGGPDIVVEIHDTVLVTRLAVWTQSLSEVIQ